MPLKLKSCSALAPKTTAQLRSIETSEQQFYVSRILPVSDIWLLGSERGLGKTWLVLNLIESLATGTIFLNYFETPKPVKVLALDRELGTYGMKERLRLFNTTSDSLWLMREDLVGLQLDQPHKAKRFIEVVKEVQPNVVTLDPLQRFLKDGVTESAVGSLLEILEELSLTLESRPSFVIAHHFRKPSLETEDLDFNNFKGAGTLVDSAATKTVLAKSLTSATTLNTSWLLRHAGAKDLERCQIEQKENFRMVIRPRTSNIRERLTGSETRVI